MELSPRVAGLLALAGIIFALIFAAAGMYGYATGMNSSGKPEAGSNFVPMCFLLAVLSVLGSGALLLQFAPGSLRRYSSTPLIMACIVLALVFVGASWLRSAPVILLRADMVMGSESQLIDQVIRYRTGQPQYTPIADANSTAYPPGAPMLTHWISTLVGRPNSVPTFRLIQQLFLLWAALFSAFAARDLYRYCFPERSDANRWLLFWIPFLYLIAANPHTNVYTFVIFSDGLALTAHCAAFWLLIRHFTTGNDRWLIPMVLMPGIGFFAKQQMAAWAVLYSSYLFFTKRYSVGRIVLFAISALGSVALAVGVCYALWGQPYIAWNFTVLTQYKVRFREIVDQVGEGSWYVALGFIGGMLLLRSGRFAKLFPVWFCWFVHMLLSIYTSGIAWRPAHLGPATQIGAAWCLVGLASLVPPRSEKEEGPADGPTLWLRSMAVLSVLFVFILGGNLFRLGSPLPGGMERYIREIEKEFEGVQGDRVLLDTGSWVYLSQNIVMKDRDSPIYTLWATEMSDFAPTIERIRNRAYDKILTRRKIDGQFMFRDDRIRQALAEYYLEARVIRSAGIPDSGWLYADQLRDVVVLVPRGTSESVVPASDNRTSPPKRD